MPGVVDFWFLYRCRIIFFRTSNDLENLPPCETSDFPDDQVRDHRIENTYKCKLDMNLVILNFNSDNNYCFER